MFNKFVLYRPNIIFGMTVVLDHFSHLLFQCRRSLNKVSLLEDKDAEC